jgi:hypothetical protein
MPMRPLLLAMRSSGISSPVICRVEAADIDPEDEHGAKPALSVPTWG